MVDINVLPQNSIFTSYDGCLYNRELTKLIRCPEGKKEIDIPESMTIVGNYAFYNCGELSSIELPNVSSIGISAFSGCTGLPPPSNRRFRREYSFYFLLFYYHTYINHIIYN